MSIFTDLQVKELLEILTLRSEVFVVEQDCAYCDPDKYDHDAIHVIGRDDDSIVAYARILAPNTRFAECSIGRVLTVKRTRRFGLGRDVMRRSLQECKNRFPTSDVRISAQCYLLEFYQELGFRSDSDQYLEDGIPHIEMIFRWKQANYI